MCMGSAMAARIPRVVYGSSDPRLGSAGGGFLDMPGADHPFHSVEVRGGVLREESEQLLTRFFRARRLARGERADDYGGSWEATLGTDECIADFRGYRSKE
jgi:hypothetical protein